MPRYRLTIEELSVRHFTRDVEAPTIAAARRLAEKALQREEWMSYEPSSSGCSVDVHSIEELK